MRIKIDLSDFAFTAMTVAGFMATVMMGAIASGDNPSNAFNPSPDLNTTTSSVEDGIPAIPVPRNTASPTYAGSLIP